MKTIVKFISTLILLVMVGVQAQNTNISVSISNSNDSYSLRARFPSEKYTDVLTVLMDNLNAKNLTESNGKQKWMLNSNDDEVYDVSLSKTRLTLELDKQVASSELIEKFDELGDTLRMVISGNNNSKAEAERLLREADRMRRDAERMQREAERLQSTAAKDAENIGDEAQRLADKANHLGVEASHRGGVSDLVKTLLDNEKTNLKLEDTTKNNWLWPSAQKDIIAALKKDGLITLEDEINFIYDDTGMYVNGTELNSKQINRYSTIFYEHHIFKNYGFSFYKSGNNIVVICDKPNIDNLINELVGERFLSSKNEFAEFNINGESVYKNGTKLSIKDLNTINTLLQENNIVPAPGKILKILKDGKGYSLGYNINGKVHFGTYHIAN